MYVVSIAAELKYIGRLSKIYSEQGFLSATQSRQILFSVQIVFPALSWKHYEGYTEVVTTMSLKVLHRCWWAL